MQHDATQRDGVNLASGTCAETQVDVFAAVDVGLVKAAEVAPQGRVDHDTRGSDCWHCSHRPKPSLDRTGKHAFVFGFGFMRKLDAHVIDCSRAGVELYIAD